MFRFAVLTLITLHTVCVLGGRIIGGTEVNITELPYQASLLLELEEKLYPICGAIIISKQAALTVGHCYYPNYNYYVRYGSSYRNKGGNLIRVAKYITHEKYNREITYDIALLVFEEAINFSDEVSSISLPNSGEKLEDNTMTTISGWGRFDGFVYPEILQKASVPIANLLRCNESIYFTTLKHGMFCAGYLSEGNKTPCLGDSGGPLVVESKVYGIITWGKRCAVNPWVFTDVAYYRKWIDDTLEKYNISLF